MSIIILASTAQHSTSHHIEHIHKASKKQAKGNYSHWVSSLHGACKEEEKEEEEEEERRMVWDGMGREAAGSVHVLAMYVDILRSSSSLIYSKSYEIEKEREREGERDRGRKGGRNNMYLHIHREKFASTIITPHRPLAQLNSTQLNSHWTAAAWQQRQSPLAIRAVDKLIIHTHTRV